MSHELAHTAPEGDAPIAQEAPHRRQLLAAIFVCLGILGALAMMELDVSLALLSLGFVGLAFVVALLCWSLGVKSDNRNVSAWDLAGASALIGFAAATIAD